MADFTLAYELLDGNAPELGSVATIPWDSRQFGFNVGQYRPTAAPPPAAIFRHALSRWVQARQVELLACSVPSPAGPWSELLAAAGFAFVDLGLTAFARRLDELPPPRLPVRAAVAADSVALLEIAASAFRFGRYHTDPRFPKPLADARYQNWMRAALTAPAENEFVFVTGPAGAPNGFLHAIVTSGVADLRLAAVANVRNGGFIGPSLFGGALRELQERGVRQAIARLSASNLSVLNLYAQMGFTFTTATEVYHRHTSPVAAG